MALRLSGAQCHAATSGMSGSALNPCSPTALRDQGSAASTGDSTQHLHDICMAILMVPSDDAFLSAIVTIPKQNRTRQHICPCTEEENAMAYR